MRRLRNAFSLLTLLTAFFATAPLQSQEVVQSPSVALKGVPFQIRITGDVGSEYRVTRSDGLEVARGTIGSGGEAQIDGLTVREGAELPLQVTIGAAALEIDPTLTSGWFSLLPPLLAIIIALFFREVITALVAGIWLGAMAVAGFNPITGMWRMMDTFIVPALADPSHASIVVFSLLLGGMVGLVSRNGGTSGIVAAVAPFASTAKRGKIATWAAGLAIFFDDYANTLIVGNTMRPITDRLKISREKLAYLVDSTAAPVAAMVPVSTWVGYEITLIQDGLNAAAATASPEVAASLTAASPFAVFLHTVPYLFYPLLALAFVLMTSIMNKDFGPMARAEARAATGGGLYRPGAQLTTDTESEAMSAKEGVAPRWWNAAIPVITTVLVILGGLYTSGVAAVGADATLMDILGAADPFATLLWGSFAGCLMAIVLSVSQKLLTMEESIEALLGGAKAMMVAMTVLVLAWSLGAVTQELGTAAFLTQLLEGNVSLQFLPLLIFITAAAMAFATGTSWTTMAILIPVVIPLTVSLGGAGDFDGGAHYSILLGAISSVLAGAIFGDHCSPISDTTVLSSTAAGCDHVDHVRTQLPYALLVAAVAMLLGDLGTAFGLPNSVALVGGVIVLFLFLKFFGTDVPQPDHTPPA